MTNLMIRLRRSPRKLLERDQHPGPGPGRLALVLARAGVGKTAFLVGIGVDALLAGQKVLHVTFDSPVEKVRDWYDDILMEMLQSEKKLEHWAAIQLQVERRRHIHTFVGQSFSIERLQQGLDVLGRAMDFVPDVIVIDRAELQDFDRKTVAALKEMAEGLGSELWMAHQIRRDGPQPEAGHLHPPVDQIEDLVDLALRLDPQGARIRLHVDKDHERMVDEDLNILLDPRTLLLTTGFSTGH